MQFKLRVVGHVDEIGKDKRSDFFQEPMPLPEIETLLNTPLKELSGPLAVNSSILGETIYLCPNDEAAREIEQVGGACYLPEEIQDLLSKSMSEEGLQKVHTIKRTFPGSRVVMVK